MSYKTYQTCYITKSTGNILVPWISSEKSEWYQIHHGFHTGLDIEANEIYSWESGVVTQIGQSENNLYSVTVQYSGQISLRYMHLKSVYVNTSDVLFAGSFIGIADKHVHFELLINDPNSSNWPVRIGTITYYKHDPEDLFTGKILLNANDNAHCYSANYQESSLFQFDKFTGSEFSNNRG